MGMTELHPGRSDAPLKKYLFDPSVATTRQPGRLRALTTLGERCLSEALVELM